MKKSKLISTCLIITLFSVILSGCGPMLGYSVAVSQDNHDYENPQWAPPYYNGARYYYIPDIETYYDLSSREFIFLNNGSWCYSRNIPPIYANFDLNDCFTVVLNINLYKPWMHHQYYVSHYPRYYYRDYYDHSNFRYVRGFNENSRSAIYWKENERNRARDWSQDNIYNNRKFKYTKEDLREQKRYQEPRRDDSQTYIRRDNDNQTHKVDRPQGQPNTPNYYGKPIGNSVKVKRDMQNNNKPDKQNKEVNRQKTSPKETQKKHDNFQEKRDKKANNNERTGGSIYRR